MGLNNSIRTVFFLDSSVLDVCPFSSVCLYTITDEADVYPYLLVNIGSGVSMVKVTGEGQFERVSGSSLGGGTFWGLCRLLTGLQDFDDMLQLSSTGDNSQVSSSQGSRAVPACRLHLRVRM